MTTFSQLVDAIVQETRRPDMKADVIRYANQTIRELHTDPETNKILFFADNFRQLLLTADVEDGFGWEIPNPATFQKLHVVNYRGVFENGVPVYSTPTTPGRHLNSLRNYHYQAANHILRGSNNQSNYLSLSTKPRRASSLEYLLVVVPC